jgi:hypothetical protein
MHVHNELLYSRVRMHSNNVVKPIVAYRRDAALAVHVWQERAFTLWLVRKRMKEGDSNLIANATVRIQGPLYTTE